VGISVCESIQKRDTPPTPLRSNHTNIELLTLVLTFGKDGERRHTAAAPALALQSRA
jgi:hypothetical protein